MSKTKKIILLIATLWPLIYICIFSAFMMYMMFTMPDGGQGEPPGGIFIFIGLHFLTIFWSLALTVIYIINVFRNDRVEGDKKALWAVVIFLGNMIAMPVYWYLYIWKEPKQAE